MSKKSAFDYLSCRNLPEMFFHQAARYGNRDFLWRKRGDSWVSTNWTVAEGQIKQLAACLRALGVLPGDRVMLVSENRPEFLIADFAIMCAGAITTPAYTTNTVDDHAYILSNSGAKAVIVSNQTLAQKVLQAAQSVSPSNRISAIVMDDCDAGFPCHRWAEALAIGRENAVDVSSIIKNISRRDTACIIYTSGTGGNPKGVMLSHGALLHNCRGAFDLLEPMGLGREVFLSFLPLSHAYEHTAGQMFPISIGAEIYYVESADKLASYLTEVRPTIMTAVPRLYEMLYARTAAAMKRAGKFQSWMLAQALELGKKKYLAPQSMGIFARAFDLVLDATVRKKVRGRFGGRLKAMVSGGAPLNYDIGLYFTALGMTILQGYGQTETAPLVSCNSFHDNKIDTVGRPVVATEVKIAEDGEILVRGELTMTGYWNNPDATAATIRDGWVHTGDIGVIDDAGRIQITDRKKDIIVLSGGDTLSPQRIEGFLNFEAEIAQSAVFGDKQSFVVALIVADENFARGKDAAAVKSAIDAAIDRANKKLSINERVRKFAVLAEGFTIENQMLTPSQKIRRHKIKAVYGERIAALY